jgi:tetratricopeptide (TPR) repeat protein
VRRAILASLLLLIGLIVAYGYAVTRQERLYRQLVAEGDAALARGDAYTAVQAFGDAIARKPDSMLGYLKRGAAHHSRGDLAAAAADLEAASRLDPTAPRAFELLGDVEFARSDYERATAHYEASVHLDDRSPRVLYKLGLARQVAGRSTEACEALTAAVALDSRFAEAHYLLGVCLRGSDRPGEAEQALKRATALAPSLFPAREQLADLYGSQGRRLARIAEMEHLLAADDRAARHVSVAQAYAAAGQTLRAVRLLRRTLEVYPADPGARLALGRVWLNAFQEGRDPAALAAAMEAFEQAVALEASGTALTELGKAYLAAGDLPAAERVFARAADTLPTDPAVFLHLADAAERAGRLAPARDALRDYVALAAESGRTPGVRQRLGDLSLRLHEPAAAAYWYARASEDPRASPALLVKLADAHRRAGDVAAARAALARVFEREPDNAAARALERQLP